MAAALVGGAALDAAFGGLLQVVVAQATQTLKFKTLLKRLEKTLKRIEPKFCEITELSKVLNRPQEETTMFTSYLEDGKELVLKCSRVKFWHVRKKFVHVNALIHLDCELLSFFQIEAPANAVSIGMRALIGINDLNDKMDQVLSAATTRAGGFSGLCSVPGLPELTIGLDRHLAELKRRLLKDETRVVVVSAPGGCGKTTLAKMLCHDKDIKGIFGENILFVTVSRASTLTAIAQKLFEHHGEKQCKFETNEEAKNQLENLMRQMGSDKRLLILDDVWSETESLVQDLQFQIPGYKILVTSRFLFPRFNNTYELSLLNDDDARTLLCYSAFPSDGIPVNVPDDLVNKVVESCKGLPLALTVVGASLCGQRVVRWRTTLKKWSEGGSILQSNSRLLLSLQTSIDALDELPIVKECFLDLGSFPEDEQIAGTALMDMWVELYNLDDEGMYASGNLLELWMRNLVNLVPIRKDAGELEGYCNEHYVTQHDLLRELAIHLSSQEPVAQRKRLFIEIHRNDFPKWWVEQIEQPINARILSISTDEAFGSHWHDLNAPNVEVLILNIRSKTYALPQFIKRMSQLKVLIVRGCRVYPAQLHDLPLIGSLSNLRRIRFDHVSVFPSIQDIFALHNLQKLTFIMCEIGDALSTTMSPCMLPNLTDLEIDLCYDLKELPAGVCSLPRLRKLSITNCHELDALPKGLGSLSNLETLSLHCCTKLQELPKSIGGLLNLSLVDISDCLSLSLLPEEIGELSGLKVFNMRGCLWLKGLPVSICTLSQLEAVICDEKTSYFWRLVESDNIDRKIKLVEDDRFASFMKISDLYENLLGKFS